MRRVTLILAALALGAMVLAQGSGSSGNASGASGGNASQRTKATTLPDNVQVHFALVDGEWRPVLTDSQGMTLYYNDQGSAKKPACTGACTKLWKPFTLPSNMAAPVGESNLTHYLSTVSRAKGGRQIALQGHPLYTFSKDAHQGQALGSSAKGSSHWHVATPALNRFT